MCLCDGSEVPTVYNIHRLEAQLLQKRHITYHPGFTVRRPIVETKFVKVFSGNFPSQKFIRVFLTGLPAK